MENFSWTPLYKELTYKLLDYKDNRTALVQWIYDELGQVTRDDGKSLVAYLKMKDGSKIQDIDPFSVFGIFNRNTSWEKRTELLKKFKEFFNLESEVPTDFNGIPTLDSRRSFFFSWFDDNDKVIQGIWELFEKVVKEENIESAFNKVIDNGLSKYSLTMCLFWIAPQRYMALDSRNRSYLETYGFSEEYPNLRYADYMSLLDDIQKAMGSGTIPASSFVEFSYMSWKAGTESPRVWMWNGDENTFALSTLKAGSWAKGKLDFSSFSSKDELGNAYREAVGNTDVKIPYAYWDFIQKVKIGDIVVVFSTRKESGKQYHLLYGWGRFTSHCQYTTEENPLQRSVSWHLPRLESPIIERKTKNDLFFHLVEGIEADNIIRLLNISDNAAISPVTSERKYWLVGYSFGSVDSQFERFIKESIWEGGFLDDSQSDQNLLSEAKTIKPGDVLILKSTSTKGPKHDQPFLRVKAVGLVMSDTKVEKKNNLTSCKCNVRYFGIQDLDFDNPTLASYRKTIHLADAKAQPIIDYANNLLESVDMAQQKYKEYIDLLLDNHNLILTGAPGTGKTFMAQEIAKEMNAKCKFVQFHPSYDYTDFVEGLRPIKNVVGEVGFERKDGIFKEFCKRAAKNLEDSKKSKQELTVEKTLEEKYNELLSKIEEGELDTLPLKTDGKNMEVVKISDFNNIILKTPGTASDRTYTVSFARLAKLAKAYPDAKSLNSISNISDSIRDVIGGCNASSYWSVLNEVYKLGTISNKEKEVEVKEEPYVFIIDEINRGEISKIFGELFFSIDPGYRGEKGRVNTQYQNLIDEDDSFKDGFFVPENVYIIGTMNDIDRSVESMDFAMRRRFAWREVSAAESMKMLDEMKNVSVEELQALKNRMINLNKAIAETDGLNEAYQIGGAYFMKYEKYHNYDLLWNNHLKGLLTEYLRGYRNSKDLLEDLYTAYSKDTIDEEAADIKG